METEKQIETVEKKIAGQAAQVIVVGHKILNLEELYTIATYSSA